MLLTEMDRFTPATRAAGLRVMLARPETTKTLLTALDEKRVAREELTLDQQQALLAHPSDDIRNRATKVLSGSGGLPSPDRAKVLTSLKHVTQQTGDAERGKQIFVKNCANCHMHRGEGNQGWTRLDRDGGSSESRVVDAYP